MSLNEFADNMILLIISTYLLLVYAILIIYYQVSWQDIPDYEVKAVSHQKDLPRITVIIPARNEEDNIADCVLSVLNQNYPRNLFEIIVADDFSTDKTAELVKGLAQDNVYVISMNEHITVPMNSYKKKAIEVAISKSSGDLIMTTDADCIVAPTWLSTIASFYIEKKASFIAAPVAFHKEQGFLGIFQSLDFMTLQGITGASVHRGFHVMCNGANLAYEKSAFYAVNGFTGIDDIASGDDMLLMHKIKQLAPSGVFYLKSKEAIVKTTAMPTVNTFMNQRIRWASKSGKYQEKKLLIILLTVYLFNLWFLVLLVIGLVWNHEALYWFSGLLAIKTIVELIYLKPVAEFFNKSKMLGWFPVAQPFHILYTIVAGWLGNFGSYKWKGRKVK